ncbi:C2 domain-containing protein 5 isoform X2 [Uranotaenia lowii]|uniref:C2 domain-containing protein 5 isoform X2 n=1 Tax=Uranotaenia lowii TaxID=190385 RepID=UPI00247B0D95|nr:C2 domain-containing protein 5 isoform X2 [Uranotaenia lowii]
MPGKVKVKILAGRNLPVMDRSSDTTDAYVEIKLGSSTHKTDVCRKSLNPTWNSDWYRFEVQRKIGLKAIDLGANAIIGYTQCFDLEGDVGVVARGIGTAVTLSKIIANQATAALDTVLAEEYDNSNSLLQIINTTKYLPSNSESITQRASQSPAKSGILGSVTTAFKDIDCNHGFNRRSSDSDISTTSKGNSLPERVIICSMHYQQTNDLMKPMNSDAMDLLEYPFLTITKVPSGFIQHLGATVSARSVKLLARVPNPDDPETRDMWWNEIRMEIRSHTRAIGCNMVLGYMETTTISEDVCVLSATGTAVVVCLQNSESFNSDSTNVSKPHVSTCAKDAMTSSLETHDLDGEFNSVVDSSIPMKCSETQENYNPDGENSMVFDSSETAAKNIPQNHKYSCELCHVPYNQNTIPFRINMMKCAACRTSSVPDILLCTIEIPEELQVNGRGIMIQAYASRVKRDLKGESNAKEISDVLPFLEIELHKLLINKLKMKGMNAIFGLNTSIAVGERMMALVATGTAVYLSALQQPMTPKIVAGNSWTNSEKLIEIQKSIQETVEKNRGIYNIKNIPTSTIQQEIPDDSDAEMLEIDLNHGNKEICLLEVDDIHDLETISMLMESCQPEGFDVVSTQFVPGLFDNDVIKNYQMFLQIWRAKLLMHQSNTCLSEQFRRLQQLIYFKLRAMTPCAICDLKFKLYLPENDEIQILVTGMALGLNDSLKTTINRKKNQSRPSAKDHHHKRNEDDLIFNLDEDCCGTPWNMPMQSSTTSYLVQTGSLKLSRRSPSGGKFGSDRNVKHMSLNERFGIEITPLTYVPGGKIEKYLGNLNFFFIRESTAVKENGGISGFIHSFIVEVLAVIRAHITALGGNAMVAFHLTELVLVDNLHKNQGQSLISAGGDVVFVSYYKDDPIS